MKKIIIFAFITLFSFEAFSQAKFTLHIIGGYSLPMNELAGTVPATIDISSGRSFNDSNTYLMKSGFNAGVLGKYAFGKEGKFRATFNGVYSHFSSSQTAAITSGGTTLAHITYEPSMNFLTFGLGVEWNFLPKKKVKPFLGIDFDVNLISGKTHILTTDSTGANTTSDTTHEMTSATRLGMGLGAGADVMLSKSLGFVVGAKYNFRNLLGKSADTTKVLGTTANHDFALNDDDYIYRGTTWLSKLIADMQFYVGASIYFGVSEKVKKK